MNQTAASDVIAPLSQKMNNSKANESIMVSRFILLHLRFLQLLGLCPVQLHHRESPPEKSARIHILWTFFHICIFVSAFAFTILSHKHWLYNGDWFSEFNDLFKLVVVMTAHLITLIESILNRNEMHRLLQIYSNLHRTWSTLNFQQEAFNYRRSIFNNVSFIIIIFGIEILYYCWNSIWDRDWNYYLIGFLPSAFICRFRIMQFIFFVELIRVELKQLNGMISSLADFTLDTSNNLPKNISSNKTCTDLKLFMELHSQIYEMVNALKKSMALSLVANYVKTYIKILSDCYWCYWVVYNNKSALEFWLIVPSVYNIMQLLLTSRNCMNEAQLVAHNLHKVKVDLDDYRTSIMLENLSLQLLHQKISIDACGLFIINCNLVRDVLGSIATYMIFYIQFMPKFQNL